MSNKPPMIKLPILDCLKCGKKYLLDTMYRRCVDCGGQISLTEGEERVGTRSRERTRTSDMSIDEI